MRRQILFLATFVVLAVFACATAAGTTPHPMYDHDDVSNASVSLDSDGERPVVPPKDDQRIGGETSLSPGTNLTLVVEATGTFYKTQQVSVQSDGTFEGTFDFEDFDAGTEFKVVVKHNTTLLLEEDGVLRNETTTTTAAATTEAMATETSTSETTTAATETSTTVAEDGAESTTTAAVDPGATTTVPESTTTSTAAETEGSGQPGFGVGVALVALTLVAFFALRRR